MMKINLKFFLDSFKVQQAVEEAMLEPKIKAAIAVQNFAKRSMKKGGGRGRTPSPPGTPPNVQKGHLRASVDWAVTEDGKVIVGPTVPYGAIHEFGGTIKARGRVHVYPERAYMRPALLVTMIKFPKLFQNMPLNKTKMGQYLNSKIGSKNG